MEVWKAAKPFVTGSMAGSVATCCIQPIDMVKVRIQVNATDGGTTNPFTIAGTMIKEEGFTSLYSGLSAGLMRQVVYTGARLGLYDIFTEKVKSPDEKTLPLYKTAGCALAAGGLGATIGNPADLALIRMQTDGMLPEAERKNYTGVGSALTGIVKGEGFMGLFAGAGPTAVRAMALNLGMLAGNTKAKDLIADVGGPAKGTGSNTFGASCIAGFLGAFFCLPFDYVKTQIQKMKPDAKTGVMPYTGPLDCAGQTFAKGGVSAFYAGFPVFYFRIAPHAMITLLAQNEVKKLWGSLGM